MGLARCCAHFADVKNYTMFLGLVKNDNICSSLFTFRLLNVTQLASHEHVWSYKWKLQFSNNV